MLTMTTVIKKEWKIELETDGIAIPSSRLRKKIREDLHEKVAILKADKKAQIEKFQLVLNEMEV